MSGTTVAALIVGAVAGGVLCLVVSGAWSRAQGWAGTGPWRPSRPASLGAGAGAVNESLARLEEQLRRMEADRQGMAGGFGQQLRALTEGQELLRAETSRLGRALRDPSARGRWGELQLRRVVEMAGMLAQCDFIEQPVLRGEEGTLRPDMVVQLPGGRNLVVDAKVPLRGWLEALEAQDEPTRRSCLADHARQLRSHVGALAAKEYWTALAGSPEMVVAFLPADGLLSAAMEADPSLMDFAVGHRVMLATPVTLIALLRAVSYGWQQEALVDNARLVAELGRELHRRLGTFAGHLAGLGRSLDRSVTAYNEAVGSLESRVMVSARRLGELSLMEPVPAAPPPLTSLTRAMTPAARPEWNDGGAVQ